MYTVNRVGIGRLHVCVLLSVCGVKGLGLFVVLFYCVLFYLKSSTVTHPVMCVGWVTVFYSVMSFLFIEHFYQNE